MQTGEYETRTVVRVTFTQEEWALLEGKTDIVHTPVDYIHGVVMRSLRRKKPKIKKDVQR